MSAKDVLVMMVSDKSGKKPITIVDAVSFTREAEKIFSKDELEDLRDHIAQFRELGDVIKNTGGLRKIRWAAPNNRGKSHGARIIYLYGGDHMPVYLIACYAKSKKATLSGPEKKAARKLVSALKAEHKEDSLKEERKLIS